MASSSLAPEISSLVPLIKTLTNQHLRDLCRSEGLAVSGVKATLQLRLIDFLERCYNEEGFSVRLDALRRRIHNIVRPSASYYQYHPPPTPQPTSAQSQMSIPMLSQPYNPGRLLFKESPFYTILEPLTQVVECKIREQTRDSAELKVTLSQATASRLQMDPNLRVMVFCAADSGLKPYTKSEIAFPHQVELKANLDEVKANLRGLKNKPGTTQPADVTNYIRKKPGYPNNIVMTYALTQKKFFVLANLVKQHPVEDLVAQLKSRKIISKEQVIREMKNRAEDADIVTTSTVMSLKCPLSTLRIQVPCRSVVCTHNQCFDASSFLELQKQAPTWTCPVCSKSTSFESLQMDQYVDDILRSTSTDVEQVVVEPDGVWSAPDDTGPIQLGGGTPASDDDDLIEITEPGVSVKKEPSTGPNISLEWTPAQSREVSTPSSAARISMSNKKRPAAAVIDLTGSDDDDESPVPPPKRTMMNVPVRALPQPSLPLPTGSPLNGRPYPPSYPPSV
ncbi:hypothetical protein N7474_002647 [Penicillium riverlandense]|uniref:uncharacterized protein n=1 Tax=Penicillium riverlandense TaxID=1903569 RepID=UPI00254978CD|nr:uncharacterized protein N7474_002647 [Penicillium riverlandense]KAJ5825509.1 hypothetical protein N7474_002647 [Penicillium riverlandense]